ncbi:hypothetical protein ACP70R_009052 [Stipagrostis hirtigluma subsp. patula]
MTSVRARGGCCLLPPSVQLNVTLLLTVAVHNPNTAGLLRLHVRAERLAAHFAQLVADVERGSVPMEASTIVPGRVTILGVFKRHAVAYSECKFVFGVAELKGTVD